jgi:hypothetical protein
MSVSDRVQDGVQQSRAHSLRCHKPASLCCGGAKSDSRLAGSALDFMDPALDTPPELSQLDTGVRIC